MTYAVDVAVDGTEGSASRRDRLDDAVFVGDVNGNELDVATNLLHDGISAGALLLHVEDDNLAAALDDLASGGLAQARGATSDNKNVSFDLNRHRDVAKRWVNLQRGKHELAGLP